MTKIPLSKALNFSCFSQQTEYHSFNCTFLNWMNMQTFIYSNQPDAVLSPAVADIFLATWGQQKQALNTTLTYF